VALDDGLAIMSRHAQARILKKRRRSARLWIGALSDEVR
jgi:hypothetical protein